MEEKNWVVAKVLNKLNYHVEFQRLYTVSGNRVSDVNRITVDKDNRPHMTVSGIHNGLGNYYYSLLKDSLPTRWESIFDSLFLDACASHDDYDGYSDTYKDIHGHRPHYTQDEWDEIVRRARKLGYV